MNLVFTLLFTLAYHLYNASSQAFWVLAFWFGFFKEIEVITASLQPLGSEIIHQGEELEEEVSRETWEKWSWSYQEQKKHTVSKSYYTKTVRSKPKEGKLHKLSTLNDLTALVEDIMSSFSENDCNRYLVAEVHKICLSVRHNSARHFAAIKTVTIVSWHPHNAEEVI